MSTQQSFTMVVAAALYLQGCHHHDDNGGNSPLHPAGNHTHKFYCRDKEWNMKMMAGCWKGNNTDQDFWLNMLYKEDENGDASLTADWVWGPKGTKGPLGEVQQASVDFSVAANGQNATLSFGDFNFNSVQSNKVDGKQLCSAWVSDQLEIHQVDCHRVCSIDQIAGTWNGTNTEGRDFTLQLNADGSGNGGTGTWTMANGNGPHPINWTYPTIPNPNPDLGITIAGDHYLKNQTCFTHFISALNDATKGDFSCTDFHGQKGNVGPDIAGVNMEIVKQEDPKTTQELAVKAQALADMAEL